MDFTNLILTVAAAMLAIINGMLGWFARQMWEAVKALRQDLSDLEVKIAREYVPYDRLQDALKPIIESLNDIKETLKTKADK